MKGIDTATKATISAIIAIPITAFDEEPDPFDLAKLYLKVGLSLRLNKGESFNNSSRLNIRCLILRTTKERLSSS
jgi:hypothetical protein